MDKIWGYVRTASPLYLVACYLLMSSAQIFSAYRMRFYYRNENVKLSGKFSIGIYLTAMLFNTVLPGGIGGDGYKIYTIGKLTGFPHLRAFKIAVSERGSGMFALLFLTSIFYIFAGFGEFIPYQSYIIAGLTILLIPCYFISIKILLKERAKTALGAMSYSFPIQTINAAIAFILLLDLGADSSNLPEIMGYLVIFMASSVAAILPLTIGGVGAREITFFYGAQLTGLNAELGISIAILFFIINFFCSLSGFFFWHRLEKTYNSSK